MEHRMVDTFGVNLFVTAAGEGPAVLMVHGFPGSSLSWRHQLPVLAAAGCRAVAVDTRGYGRSDRPESGYDAETVERDLLGLLDALEIDQAVVVGQDFGSRYAWNLARHHPDRVRGVVGTVPFSDLPQDQPPTQLWRSLAADRFLHLDYFQAPGVAERDLGGEHVEEFLARLLWALSGGGDYFSVLAHPSATSYLDALPPAPALPWRWLNEADFAAFVEGLRRGGPGREYAGGLGAYRAADADWAYESRWLGQVIEPPAMLLIGERDPVRRFATLDRSLFRDLSEVVVPEAGHHVQQEQPRAVNDALLGFIAHLDP
jgi:pimeloyl-ACP methyl ester carboxylesterase